MPRRKKEEQPQEEIKKIKTPAIVDGSKDSLPSDAKYWDFVEDQVRSAIHDHSFIRMRTPVIEKYELFNHTLFKQSGALEKEVFSFIDKGQKLILRPEMTSSIARAFVSHNMASQTLPLKVYSWGPVFRQARADLNRLRQFMQASFEIVGDRSPAVDSELIIVAHYLLNNLNLSTEVVVNSAGCVVCRPEYSKALSGYLKTKRAAICVDCRKRTTKDPLRFLSCESNKCLRLKEDAPQTVDWLCDECRNHLFRVLEYLDESKVPYRLDSGLVRTYDYYCKTIFEIYQSGEGVERVPLAGGGRYDYLIEMLGGNSTPAAGFAIGLERVINALKVSKVEIPKIEGPDVFVAQIGEQARQKVFAFFENLRKQDFSVKGNFSKSSLKAQLDQAIKIGAKFVLILGQKEVAEGTVLLRDLDSGIQEVINRSKIIQEIKKRLKERGKAA